MQDAFGRPTRITDREDDYRKRRLARALSPARNDAFAMGDQTPDARVRTYADVMKDQQLSREKDNTLQVFCQPPLGVTVCDFPAWGSLPCCPNMRETHARSII